MVKHKGGMHCMCASAALRCACAGAALRCACAGAALRCACAGAALRCACAGAALHVCECCAVCLRVLCRPRGVQHPPQHQHVS